MGNDSLKHASRDSFTSKFGVLLATVGTAVGLGNIWRFPYVAGEYGGGAFILFYFIFIFVLGIPGMVAEFIVGRKAHANPVGAFTKLTEKGSPWRILGYMGVYSGLLIMGYYAVVVGWTLQYLIQSLMGNLQDLTVEGYNTLFDSFAADPVWPLVWLAIVLVMTHLIVKKGVSSGIEKASRVMMPVLFFMLVAMAIHSFFVPGAREGFKFMLFPNFQELTAEGVLIAMGQVFYSLSLGMGCLITYASYFKDDVNLPRTAVKVALLDTLVALLASAIIFPAIFSFHVAPAQGPGLVYKILPNVFQQMPGGYIWSFMFYGLLFIAALTSLISLHEVVTSYLHENYKMKRARASFWVMVAAFILGIFASLSFGPFQNATIGGKNIFSILDFVTSSILLPLGAMFTCLFVGWHLNQDTVREQLHIEKGTKKFFFNSYIFLLRFLVPAGIFVIFIFSLVQAFM